MFSRNVIQSSNQFTMTHHILIIDSQVDDYQQLVAGAKPEFDVFVLDAHRNGIKQITQILNASIPTPHASLSLHIVSHGSPGTLYLGNSQLSLDTLEYYTEQLQTWFTPHPASLTPHALYLYGCNVAAGDAGEQFLEKLTQTTQAFIYASAHVVGSAQQGGSWDLNRATPDSSWPTAQLAFSTQVLSSYQGAFPQTINPTGGGSGGDDLRIVVYEDGRFQVYEDGIKQIYSGNPDNSPNTSFSLALGIGSTTYAGFTSGTDDVTALNNNPQLKLINQSSVSGLGTATNPYAVSTTLYADVNGNNVYDAATDVQIEWVVQYADPNDFFLNQFKVTAPINNTSPIRIYQHFDSSLAGGDEGAAYGLTSSGSELTGTSDNPKFIGVRKNAGTGNEIVMGYIENQGEFSRWFSGDYDLPDNQVDNGGNLINTYNTVATTDNGIAVQYDLGTVTGTATVSNFLLFSTEALNNIINNTPPVFTSDANPSAAENSTVAFTVAATDANGNPITYSISGGADASNFSINTTTGELSFINSPNFEDPGDSNSDNIYEVQVTANDGIGGTTAQTINITVTDGNDAPSVSTAVTETATEDDAAFTVDLLAGASDPDSNDTLTVTDLMLEGGDDSGVTLNGNNLEIDPSAYSGLAEGESEVITYSYSISDGNGGTASQTASITINGANDAPIFVSYQTQTVPLVADDLVAGAPGVTSILANAEDDTAEIDLGASTFTFYGSPYSRLFVSSNGLITFGSANDGSTNQDLSSSPQQAAIAPFWDDLLTQNDANDQVLYAFRDVDGDSIDDQLIIEWQAYHIDISTNPINFQTVLALNTANSGNILFNYIDLETGDPLIDNGASATVGIKNANGSSTLISFEDGTNPLIGSGQAILLAAESGDISVSVSEGSSGVIYTASAVDPENDAVTYTIVGGADLALFEIDSSTGALSFITTPDFEAPADADENNVYDVLVEASDGSASATQFLQVTVTNVNDNVPVFTSSATPTLAENSTAVTTVVATDADGDPISYSISGGVDAALFQVDATTGELSFITAPDFENPTDDNGDSVYEVTVSASDGSAATTQTLSVSVTDLSNGVTDFNNDNQPDVVWRRPSTGQTNIWFTDGQNKIGGGPAGATIENPNWLTVGVGDFDKDGKRDDILWRNVADGRNVVWFMDGINKVGNATLNSIGTNWEVQGVGDFDHQDYTDDILWRNQSTGQTVVWTMDGTTKTGTINFGTLGTAWKAQGVGDFEANNFVDDIVWRNYTTGQTLVWETDGQQKTGSFALDTVGTNWKIDGVGDLDGDGTVDDLLWYNTSNNNVVTWFIDNGAKVASSTIGAPSNGWDAVL